MAKINAETIEDVVGVVKKAASEGEAESIAKSLKIDTKDVQKIVDGKASKTLIKRVFETAGSTIRGLQGKLDEALNRPKPSPTAFPGALQEIPTQVDGTMATGRGGPLVPVPRPAPEPAGPTALERIGAKAAIGGGEPPRVPSEFTTEQIRSKGETGYQIPGQPGGPIVPAQSRALSRVSEGLAANEVVYDPVTKAPMSAETAVVPYGSRFDRPVASPEEIAQAASRAKAGPAGEGVSEFTPGIKVSKGDESAQQAERAAELELNMDLSMTPSPESMRKAGKLAAGAGAAGGLTMAGITGMKLFGDKPLASQEGAGDTTRVAEVVGTPDVKAMANKALPHLPDQAKEVIQNQVQKVLSIEERLDKELSSARARYDKEVARKELLQAIETVMHGLVTALGAKAALDRGSPFAIDFSKGPQVNWESKFANLQKDFELQTNSIVKKYDLEQKERLEQQKAAESSRRYEERMALEREKLGVEKAKAGQQAAKQQAEEAAKLNAEQQKQYNTNLKTFALLKEAIETKNLGNIQQYGIALGAKPETINEIKAEASKGGLRKAIERAAQEINLIPPTKDVAEELRPQKPAAQSVQADEVVVELNGVQGAIPANQVDAFVKANPGAKIIK